MENAPVNLKKGVPFEEAEVNRRGGGLLVAKPHLHDEMPIIFATLLDFKLSLIIAPAT